MRFQRHYFELGQSIITFLCDVSFIEAGKHAVREIRQDLENYIQEHEIFAISHKPVTPKNNAPDIIRRMCDASALVGVGPMATVAGAVAKAALDAILAAGAEEAIVDNGGDIALCIHETTRVGIFAGLKGTHNLAFKIEPRKEPFGICTSSGTVGHSFSYGKCDAATVISKDVLLADAAATALGNQILDQSDIENAFNVFNNIEAIEGALTIYGDQIGLWGQLPRLLQANVDTKLITKGEEP
jgi:ApbE superfamily uncharacterized protein (UPF0280 family)